MSQSASIPQIAEVLARAFTNDPFYTYIMPDASKRPRQLRWWMRNLVRYGYRYGKVQLTAKPLAGAAIWLAPPHEQPGRWKMLRSGMGSGPLRLGWRGFYRLLHFIRGLQAHRRSEPPHFWYLMILGVDPKRQGQGVGSALLQETLWQADREGRHCYLETMTERNVVFYQRHGFRPLPHDDGGQAGPYWTMRRAPQTYRLKDHALIGDRPTEVRTELTEKSDVVIHGITGA